MSDDLDNLIEQIAISVMYEATKNKNFQILQMLPTNVEDIIKHLEITKVPVTNRLNALEKFDLLKWYKGIGLVFPTEMTGVVLTLVERMEKIVKPEISKMLPKLIT